MKLPHAFQPYVSSGGRIAVRVGVVVWAVEGEPEQLVRAGRPSVFPWLAVRSSDSRVLAPVTLCTHEPLTFGIPEHVYAFRARRSGRATLSAALAPAWRVVASRPTRYRATVTVAP